MLYVTPSQRASHQETLARRARIAARVYKAPEPAVIQPIVFVAPPAIEPDPCAIDVTCWPPIPGYKPCELKYPKIRLIQLRVCDHFQIGIHDLLSRRRTAVVVMPRHIAIYLCKTMTINSYPEIGRRFGGLDHTSALYAVRRITRLVAQDEKLEATVFKIRETIQ